MGCKKMGTSCGSGFAVLSVFFQALPETALMVIRFLGGAAPTKHP
jgi:hypothetical protein